MRGAAIGHALAQRALSHQQTARVVLVEERRALLAGDVLRRWRSEGGRRYIATGSQGGLGGSLGMGGAWLPLMFICGTQSEAEKVKEELMEKIREGKE